jgi:hypothetical protein
MTKRLFISFLLLASFIGLKSQSYPFDSIPDRLKKKAVAVIRSEQCLYTVHSPGSTTQKIKRVITLLNEKATSYRFLQMYYDKSSRIKNIKGTIYDEKGKIIKIMGIADVFDMSAISGGSFYSDDRIKVMYFPIFRYPYTIEYEYEVEYSSVMDYPTWYFHADPETSVEKSGIQFVLPLNMTLRYFTRYTQNPVDSIITADYKTFTWQEENLPVTYREDLAIQTYYPQPVLYTGPIDFEYGGYKGSMESWKTFGNWIYNLNNGRDALPENEKSAVLKLVSGTPDIREKTKLIYEYMQSKTRYVSIQIGIGGFRPAEASSVSSNGFGDCKALVNYTMSLLKCAGIKSYYSLVNAGDDGTVYKDFIANQFNHVILCVPIQNDTVWLDCTSQTLPFNYLGDFSDNRYALMITPEGGKLVRTPKYNKQENLTERSGLMFMNTLGAASGTLNNHFTGYNFGNADMLYGSQSEDEMKRYVSSSMAFSSISVSKANYDKEKSEKPSAVFSSTVSINDFSTIESKRLYFNPSLRKLPFLQDTPIIFNISEAEIIRDSISYYLPSGYKINYLPHDLTIENEFGSYVYSIKLLNDKVTCIRQFEINNGTIPLSKYESFRSFVNKAARKDREKIILIKSES